jgi:hypothetical protein
MAVNSADPSRATVTAVAFMVLDTPIEEVVEVVAEETLDKVEDAVEEEPPDEGEDAAEEEPLDGEDVVEDWTEDPDRSVEVPGCAVASAMRPTTPTMSERIVVKESKEVAILSNTKAVVRQWPINPTNV